MNPQLPPTADQISHPDGEFLRQFVNRPGAIFHVNTEEQRAAVAPIAAREGWEVKLNVNHMNERNTMTTEDAIKRLDDMQSQVIHGPRTLGEIADVIRSQQAQLDQAKRAIHHVLNTICDDPRKYWLLGNGTESYARLTAAHATLRKLDVKAVRADFQPEKEMYSRHCKEMESKEALLRYCHERGITLEE